MRLSVPTLVLLTGLAAVPVALGSPPASAVDTCQGQAVTVPAAENGYTKGTPGDDVIAAEGAIEAYGGDDLICLRSGGFVDAGDGDDRVFVEDGDAQSPTRTILGPGDDRFEGGPGRDVLTDVTDNPDDGPTQYPDDGDDVIRTYGGNDSALAGGRTGPAQTDDIDLGEGDDRLYVDAASGTTPASTLTGGPGADRIQLMVERGHVDVRLLRAELRVSSRLAASGWTDLEATTVSAPPFGGLGPPPAILVRGTSGPDTVAIGDDTYADQIDHDFPNVSSLQVELGPGDDTLWTLPWRGRLDGGDGRDGITLLTGATVAARLDLGTGLYTTRGSDDTSRAVVGFQDATLVPATPHRQVWLIGNQYRNRLTAPCGLIRGGPNDDEISSGNTGRSFCRSVRFYGDRGNDRIIGTNTTDLLDGGPGSDVANGLGGTDRCVAFERRANCES